MPKFLQICLEGKQGKPQAGSLVINEIKVLTKGVDGMLLEFVTVGDRIELKRIGTSINKKSKSVTDEKLYLSKVYDILGDDKLTIAMPIEEGRIIPLQVGSRYEVVFITKKGLYQCNAVIEKRYKQNALYVLVISLISNLEKHQRRQYYRLECLLDFQYKILQEEEMKNFQQNADCILEKDSFQKATALDISGGGIRCVSPEKLSVGSKLVVLLNLELSDGNHEFTILSNVKDANVMKNNNGLYEARLEFIVIQKKAREILIKYIFENDRIHRKKARE